MSSLFGIWAFIWLFFSGWAFAKGLCHDAVLYFNLFLSNGLLAGICGGKDLREMDNVLRR